MNALHGEAFSRDLTNGNIVLTGFMGSGKTTVGRLLADNLGFEFVDTDDLIEEEHGPIAEIFATQGEDSFRDMERTVAARLSERSGVVISTGGRMLLDDQNADALATSGRIFCLAASIDEILARLGSADELAKRPLLAGADARERITQLLAQRADGYGRFEQVPTDGRTTNTIVSDIHGRVTGVGRQATSVAEVVSSGLCIGCGLCEAVTDHRVQMVSNESGSLRPSPVDGFTESEETAILAACPGVVSMPRSSLDVPVDDVWGRVSDMRYAWAGDPEVRYQAATGGVLTALGVTLIETGQARFILHVGADPDAPMRSRWVMSETVADVRANTGSWYGPTAPLAGLGDALDRNEPFAVIAKPCDLGALHAYSSIDDRVDELVVARLTMVCGGQSRFEKSADVINELGLDESEVSLFRYRGYGNPGPTRVETHDGKAFELTYNEMWDDIAGWKTESRCTVCPDALGEASDVAAADVWPGGGPTGEDEGFNGIMVRSQAGAVLIAAAVRGGFLVLGDEITLREYDDLQPHQVRKKVGLAARNAGLTAAGHPVIATTGLRVDELGQRLSPEENEVEISGTTARVNKGRYAG